MRFLDNVVKKGDALTLTRGTNRITVVFERDITHAFDPLSVIGLQDDLGQSWYTDADHKSAWRVVGHTIQETPTPLPTDEGWYLLTGDDYEGHFEAFTVYLTSDGKWVDGGLRGDSTPYSEEFIRNYGPVLRLSVSGEHYTAISSMRDKFYDLYVQEDGSLTCTCAGFVYRKTCRHVTETKLVRATQADAQ